MSSKHDARPRIGNDGKTSESLFEAAMRERGFAVFRLRDKRDLHGLNRRSVAAFGQPSDYIVLGPTSAFLCEVKSSHEKTSFPLSCFTRAQRSAMAQCVACNVGHNYWVYIHNMNTDEWYKCTSIDVIKTINATRKSIPWNDLTYIGEI